MPHYFYVVGARRFVTEIQPALGEAWAKKSFEPCRELCERLGPAAEGFALSHRIDPDAMFIERIAAGMAFSKDAWRSLVSDLLMVAASMMPEIQTAPETLCCLLDPPLAPRGRGAGGEGSVTSDVATPSPQPLSPDGERGLQRHRKAFTAIEQAHFGSRDLSFGGGFYRPEKAGWNDAADVARLADYLAAIDARVWTPEQLTPLTEIAAEDRAEELEFAKQCLQNLTILYQSARPGHVIVCEVM